MMGTAGAAKAADVIVGEKATKKRLIGPPHTARHTGASRDLAGGRRSFDEIKRRGRWKADDGVQTTRGQTRGGLQLSGKRSV